MSLATHSHRLTFVINSTVVDSDTLRRIGEQLQKLLNDPDGLLPEVSTTTIFQAMPSTIIVTETQTSVVTATVTAARTITEVPFTTFQPSQENNNLLTMTSTETSSSLVTTSLPLITSLSTSPLTSASSPSPLLLSTTSTIFSSVISTDLPSTTLSPPTKKSLPPGAIIGIVILCMAILFLVIYFIRWRLRRKREGSRKWITPFVTEKPVERPSLTRRQEKRMELLYERWQRMCNSRRNRGAANAGNSSGGPNNGARRKTDDGEQVSAPPVAYRGPSAGRPVQDSLLVSSVFPKGAVVKLRFEPRKQDELRALPGDYLKVVTLFDDGWAFCKNSRGEKGMVPTTCLRAIRVGRMGNG